MAKQTRTQTYRVSDEVDAELRRLAKIHGGIDKALRVLMDNLSPLSNFEQRVVTDYVGLRPLREKGDKRYKRTALRFTTKA